jgi:hypothetical protein
MKIYVIFNEYFEFSTIVLYYKYRRYSIYCLIMDGSLPCNTEMRTIHFKRRLEFIGNVKRNPMEHESPLNHILIFKLFGRNSFILFKLLNKITGCGEAYGQSDLCYVKLGGAKQLFSFGDPDIV